MTIDLSKSECIELLNNIAGGLACNPEFIKATIIRGGYSEVGTQIAKKAKDAINEINFSLEVGSDYSGYKNCS